MVTRTDKNHTFVIIFKTIDFRAYVCIEVEYKSVYCGHFDTNMMSVSAFIPEIWCIHGFLDQTRYYLKCVFSLTLHQNV